MGLICSVLNQQQNIKDEIVYSHCPSSLPAHILNYWAKSWGFSVSMIYLNITKVLNQSISF